MLLDSQPYCDSWINFQYNPGDFALPYCPISICEHDIRRVTQYLRPSVLMEDKPWETLAFSFWFIIEQRVVVVGDFLATCYGNFKNIAFEFVVSHAPTIYMLHSMFPWRFVSGVFRSLHRSARNQYAH